METKHINLEYLKNMSGGNYATIKDLAAIFMDEVPKLLQSMEDSVEKQDWNELRTIAHKSKSSLSIFGMNNLANEMSTLEKMAKDEKDTENYPNIISDFRSSCHEAIDELNAFLETQV